MINSLKKIMYSRKREMLWYLIFIFGACALGTIMLTAVVLFDSEATTFTICTMMSLLAWIMYTLFSGAGVAEYFNNAVGMGMTRKHFIPCYFTSSLIIYSINAVLIELICLAESFVIHKYISFIPQETGVEIFVRSGYFPLVVVAVAVFNLISGVVYLKLGPKAMAISYFALMIPAFFIAKVADMIEENPDSSLARFGMAVVDFFMKLSSTQLVIGALIAVVLAYGACHLSMRKQQVM